MIKFIYGSDYTVTCKKVEEFCDKETVDSLETIPQYHSVFGFILYYTPSKK